MTYVEGDHINIIQCILPHSHRTNILSIESVIAPKLGIIHINLYQSWERAQPPQSWHRFSPRFFLNHTKPMSGLYLQNSPWTTSFLYLSRPEPKLPKGHKWKNAIPYLCVCAYVYVMSLQIRCYFCIYFRVNLLL